MYVSFKKQWYKSIIILTAFLLLLFYMYELQLLEQLNPHSSIILPLAITA